MAAHAQKRAVRAHAPIGLKCAPLDLARRYASFGTLESQIGHMVMKILTVYQNSDGRTDTRTQAPFILDKKSVLDDD